MSEQGSELPRDLGARRDLILDVVREAGFDLAGCLPLEEAGDERFEEWLAAGHHGTMAWMERHLLAKGSPADAWPEHQSVVVVGLEYGNHATPPEDPRLGRISRYALGDDYHEVLKERLFAAADALRQRFPGLLTRPFVDTGPLNEKLVAERAGLGWRGRNTNFITKERGSYLFLGVLLLSCELPAPEGMEKERCGLCTDCLPACPTDAFVAPGVLDARRCISYLTIELRGPIPRDLRPLIGNRIFGCDDCQEVCPWNRFARSEAPERLRARDGATSTELRSWAALDLEEWRRRFRRSPVKRSGHTGFLRNVLVACGNSREAGLFDTALGFLRHPDEILRESAAWALSRLAGEEARPHLLDLKEDTSPLVREEVARCLVEGPVSAPAERKSGQKRRET